MALETALEDIPVVSMPTVHSLKKGIFGVLLCGTTTHFKVAYYCESKHCAPIMLFNQHVDMPHLSGGWVFLGKGQALTARSNLREVIL